MVSHIFFIVFRQLCQAIQLFFINTVLFLDFVLQFGRPFPIRKNIRHYFYKKVTGKPGLSLLTFVVGQAVVKKQVGPWL